MPPYSPAPMLTPGYSNHSSFNRKIILLSSQTLPIPFHLAQSQNPYKSHCSHPLSFISFCPRHSLHSNQSQSLLLSNETSTPLPRSLFPRIPTGLFLSPSLSLCPKHRLSSEAFPEHSIYNWTPYIFTKALLPSNRLYISVVYSLCLSDRLSTPWRQKVLFILLTTVSRVLRILSGKW